MRQADIVVIAKCNGRIETNKRSLLAVPSHLEEHITVDAYRFSPSLVLKGVVPEGPLILENFAMKDLGATKGRRHSAMVEFRVGKQKFRGVDWVAILDFEYLLFLRKLPSGRFALMGNFEEMKESARIVSPVF
ncbi:hypothetical protein Enr13x_34280 [Stieleria neptunia]|uniref:Uncharacterized protein n=1 Tax=Stieleria neptunia TaxID=2527979 RepID=A0A518HRY6_9BACT|nr:hypothetical protein [Stieleria neptunia]QDV43571.1 hypothetical protein Enr13x_34280 [Stieleria neptunia]